MLSNLSITKSDWSIERDSECR